MSVDLIDHYLPPEFAARLPSAERAWRGRTVLILWGLGYPLEMAWSLGLADDPDQAASYRQSIDQLDDTRLIDLLNATVERRGDGSHLMFASFGDPSDDVPHGHHHGIGRGSCR